MTNQTNTKANEGTNLRNRLERLARREGADFFGVADLNLAREEAVRQDQAQIGEYPRAISVGIRLLDGIVDLLPFRDQRAVAVSYRTHCYEVVNTRLDLLASRMGSMLQNSGHRVFVVPSTARVDDERLCAIFSHKLAARLAGLGWIGKSCLLVTPEAGPRVRWVTILTDAPLTPGEPMDPRCGHCSECARACPAGALTGREFHADEPREVRLDASRCKAHLEALNNEGRPQVCGLCLHACPHGRKRRGGRRDKGSDRCRPPFALRDMDEGPVPGHDQ